MKYSKRNLSFNPITISIAGTLLTVFFLTRLVLSFFSISLFQLLSFQGIFKPYVPDFKNTPGVEFYDLRNYQGNQDGWQQGDRILFCVPLRDASEHLPMFFDHLNTMSYPHNLIDLSFLVSDSSDNTMGVLLSKLQVAQSQQDKTKRFGNIEIYEKDFGQIIGQSFSDRHGFGAQGPRRKLMARARNWLGSVALKPYHSWVYWRDVDVETIPSTIMEDLMHHDKDVIVPNVWRPLPDWLGNIQPYDLNSWKESEGGLQLADALDEDAVIVEGYPEYATWRPHLAYMRDPNGNPEDEMELDGIGGVSILAKAKVFRTGSHFPAFSFEKHAETEAFGRLSRRMNYNVIGLPHYVIWHIYEPSSDDLKHMAWMAEEEKRKLEEERIREFYNKIWDIGFEDVRYQWTEERDFILKNIDSTLNSKVTVDWSEEGDGSELVDSKGEFVSPNNQQQQQQQQQQKKQQDSNPQGKLHDGNDKNKKMLPKEVPLDFDPDRN
ncbi:hypothetical protein SEUBUCD646_0E00470 [Saccharomyces eubayanus]|uniref:Mannan polymerase II complex anp1 subunit n=2 Tax=Saccharomyces TaxID=4930 RepID=A0A6C1E7H6_SACPS|nr:Mannan polymerase II complex anp1 subunit [Saccharomyces pastorianus]CAI1942573.1 hypothetical protein SEUBUCD650_0E00480 [Saccharomyces eubayanus]CAI1972289.1 hypothetical protein SEUBUCD646_0E00470 [Saccharomyces eubayanus]